VSEISGTPSLYFEQVRYYLVPGKTMWIAAGGNLAVAIFSLRLKSVSL